MLAQRWRGWSIGGANASHNTHVSVCRWQSTRNKPHVCTRASVPARTRFQTVHILPGCAPISRINERPLRFTVKQHGGSGERAAAACNFSGLPSIMQSTLSLWGRMVAVIYQSLQHGWVTFPNKIITCNLLCSTHTIKYIIHMWNLLNVQMQHSCGKSTALQYVSRYLMEEITFFYCY